MASGRCSSPLSGRADFPLVVGVVVVIGFGVVLINLITDLSYAMIDPRIRYG